MTGMRREETASFRLLFMSSSRDCAFWAIEQMGRLTYNWNIHTEEIVGMTGYEEML